MTDDIDDYNEDQAAEGKQGGKKSGKATGTGSIGASKAPVSPAFFEHMKRIGASMEQITRILRDWAHLKGEALGRALSEFGRFMPKSSNQPVVDFSGNYAVVTGFLNHCKSTVAPITKPMPDATQGPR